MRLLLDQGLPRSAAEELRRRGFVAEHAGEVGLAKASDDEIADQALRENQAIVTLDADFHALLARRNARGPSVMRIRIEGLRGEQAAELIERVVAQCSEDLVDGAMVTVDEHRVRVRALPLVR